MRAGYDDQIDGWELIRWRGAVNSAIKGRRGQTFLRELRDAMDAMPRKRLIEEELVTPDGEVCTLGVLCLTRQLNVEGIDVEDGEAVGKLLGIAEALAREIEYENDEGTWRLETPEQRWSRMRAWVSEQIKPSVA